MDFPGRQAGEEDSGGPPRGDAAAASPQGAAGIAVTDPVKHGDGVNAYMSYRVVSKSKEARGTEREGIRRFSDFEWLHTRLCATHPGIIVPPLPDKNVVEKFRFSREFIEARRRGLERFICGVALHPVLGSAPELGHFLQDDEDTWSRRSSVPADTRGGVLGKKSSEYMSIFKEMQWSLSSVVMGTPRPTPPSAAHAPAPSTRQEAAGRARGAAAQNGVGSFALCSEEEGERLKAYAEELERVFMDAHKQAYMFLRKQRETASSLAGLGSALLALGKCEAAGPQAWPSADSPASSSSAASAAEDPSAPQSSGAGAEAPTAQQQQHAQAQGALLGRAYADVGTRCKAVASLISDQGAAYSEQVEDSLKMYTRFVASLKRVLAEQAAVAREERHLEADLHMKKARLDKFQASLSPLERVKEAEAEVTEADARVGAAAEARERLNLALQADLQRFHGGMLKDVAALLGQLKALHSQLAQRTAQCWQEGLPLLTRARTALAEPTAAAAAHVGLASSGAAHPSLDPTVAASNGTAAS